MVGGEFVFLDEEHVLARERQGSGGKLEEIDRHIVRDDDLAFARADQGCDPVSCALREVDPAGAVPAADKVVRPGRLRGRELRLRGPGWRSQRMPDEIDDAFRQLELPGRRSQWIAPVEIFRFGAGRRELEGHWIACLCG